MKLFQKQVSYEPDQAEGYIENNDGIISDGKISDRKLVLHFDQHNTIQVACTLPGQTITVEEGLNNFLTSAVWGKEINKKWTWVCNEPQILKPENEPDAITYFKYLEKRIVKKPEDRIEFKKITTKFVYEEPGVKFRPFFDLYLESLRYEKPVTAKRPTSSISACWSCIGCGSNTAPIKLCNTIPSGDPKDQSDYHLIFPSFFDMIRRLQNSNREFTIILRTMGIDSEGFLECVESVLSGSHRDFGDIKPMTVNRNVGRIKRYENDKIKLFMDDKEFDDEKSIYKKLSSLTGINAIRDDFDFWQKNNYDCYSAKPLWIDLDDANHQHIIFDDNIRLEKHDDCIVNVRLKNKNCEHKYDKIPFNRYHIFESTNILQPNLIELLNPLLKKDSNKNHYCEKLKKAEIIYHKLSTSISEN